jgi:hypothetical protein
MLSVIRQSVAMLSALMLCVSMLNIVLLSVFMLSFMAPPKIMSVSSKQSTNKSNIKQRMQKA